MTTKRFSREEIDKRTQHISNLEQKERDAVRQAMYARLRVGDGMIGEEELHLELKKLRDAHVISDTDLKRVQEAFFGE